MILGASLVTNTTSFRTTASTFVTKVDAVVLKAVVASALPRSCLQLPHVFASMLCQMQNAKRGAHGIKTLLLQQSIQALEKLVELALRERCSAPRVRSGIRYSRELQETLY